ncbi:DNA replication complex GINS protein PSF3 [Pseudovirgaria hyperparasitica]|uniref:DNA replication complex GINS protein PSF3 n=1 Tax=Pseudovirgaria hyperparasitica TaxID=470096 RepID=A0A6A6VWE8_9PEZI|nr:DNA replication complex GINS protein PSF3 [Pseudovirgaria hyperparasitica]KAF2754912.1 DNA replication complex GINS protein PSF3 [Pseudovirgaria hyperparasitica]
MSSYYSPSALLTDAQKVPCTFTLTVPGLGYLDATPEADLASGTKVSLPLWLGEMLAISQNLSTSSLVKLDFPPALSERVLNALKADPRTVDLRQQAANFYALGIRMLDLFEHEEMGEVLTETFKTRAASIADQAHNPRGALGEGADFLRGLDESERELFKAAHDSSKAVRTWMAEISKK